MNPIIKEFHDGVRRQAISGGMTAELADRIAAQAVLDRVHTSEVGFAIAQSSDFEPIEYHTFEVRNIRIDQSEDGGVIVDAVLTSPEEDEVGNSFDEAALKKYEELINAGLVGGYEDDNHRGFREKRTRDINTSVTEWVKARVEAGRLWISAKLKKGHEHLAEKFKFLSGEYEFGKSERKVIAPGKRKVTGGTLAGFIFTNKPKQSMNRIVNVRAA
jgi:hypothetical protein